MCVTDFSERGPFWPPPHPWAASKKPILNRVNVEVVISRCFVVLLIAKDFFLSCNHSIKLNYLLQYFIWKIAEYFLLVTIYDPCFSNKWSSCLPLKFTQISTDWKNIQKTFQPNPTCQKWLYKELRIKNDYSWYRNFRLKP